MSIPLVSPLPFQTMSCRASSAVLSALQGTHIVVAPTLRHVKALQRLVPHLDQTEPLHYDTPELHQCTAPPISHVGRVVWVPLADPFGLVSVDDLYIRHFLDAEATKFVQRWNTAIKKGNHVFMASTFTVIDEALQIAPLRDQTGRKFALTPESTTEDTLQNYAMVFNDEPETPSE